MIADQSVGTLHFDLSHAPENAQHTLNLAGKTYPLTPHSAETRACYAASNPMLGAVPPDQQHHISHFADNVMLPAVHTLMWVQHPSQDPNAQLPAVSLLASHHPAAATADKAGAPSALATQKLALMGATLDPASLPDLSDDHAHSFKTPLDTAISLVSMHPELMHLDSGVARQIHDNHVTSARGVTDLAVALRRQGPAETTSGWARISACVDENGKALTHADGTPMYQYVPSDETRQAMEAPIKGALRTSKNDIALKDKTWGQNYGVSSIDHSAVVKSATATRATSTVVETPQPTPPTDKDAHWTPGNWSSIYGLNLSSAQSDSVTPSNYTIDATNNALRHMSTWVDLLDDMGNVLSGRGNSLALLPPGNFLMGIPISTQSVTLAFSIPDDAAGARLYFGTLGTGHFDRDIAGMGLFCTALFEFAVPTLLLISGAFKSDDPSLGQIMQDNVFITVTVGAIALDILTPEILNSIEKDPVGTLVLIGNKLMGVLLKESMGKLRTWVLEQMAESRAKECIPFVGLVLYALGVAGTLASLAETTAAVAQTSSISSVDIQPTMTLQVNVHPDPQHSIWPSTSRKYRLIVQYQGGTFMHLDGEMSEFTKGVTSDATVTKSFLNVPAGGKLKVYAVIYSGNWWICGYAASADWVVARPGDDNTLSIDLTIKENLVPLTADTKYSYNEKLAYSAKDGHHWVSGDDTAPTATKTALDDTPGDQHLADLVEITINDHAHMLGYCWRASSQGLNFADGTDGGQAQMYAFQNVSYLASPETALKATNRGLTSRPHILYDQFGPIAVGATGAGNNFYLDVVGEVYHLRRIDFDAKPIDLAPSTPPLSWGKFTQPHLDAVVVHPGGYVAGVSWTNSKMEILQIPTQGSADADAKVATLVSGEGSREGLMYGPVALAVTMDGNFLVLESTNNRVQAFDVAGCPVQAFNDGDSGKLSYMSLKSRVGVTYLDLATESKGYIYVLSYTGDGSDTADYHLDIYQPTGEYLSTTEGLNAAKMTVSMWRDLYALNYEKLLGPNNRTEPSISQWIPSTPAGTDPNS
jgi:hypothetical protein